MTAHTIHASRPGLRGDHRTDGLRCLCDPWQLQDMNEPGRLVIVHRPFDEDAGARERRDQARPATTPASSLAPFHPVRLR